MPTIDPCGGVPKEETIEGVSVEDMASVTGMNSAYYVPRFYKMSKGGSKCSWNWPAFLLTPYWLLYRKNYWMGVVLMVLNVVRTAVSAYILNVQIAPVLSPCLLYTSGTITEKNTDKLLEKVAAAAREQGVQQLVVGHPRNMDGSRGESARRAETFAASLEKAAALPVVLWDERMTTVSAIGYQMCIRDRGIPTSVCVWKPAGRIKSACTWPTWAIPWPATPCTGHRSLSKVSRGSACTVSYTHLALTVWNTHRMERTV